MNIFGDISLTWRDAVDIVLLTALFYQIIMMIRGTRAVSAIFGLFFLIVAYYISGRLGIYTLHWLLQNFLGSLFLIVIVLFQRDIRQGLSAMGAKNFRLLRHRKGGAENSLDDIVGAAMYMSQARIGALIVFERSMRLGDTMERGVILHARISRELLIALFYPKSPMHDGAVIIRDNEILAAGCILPLAPGDGNRNYGTRHRAALGISEESDSVVLVVSEERGTVSIAVGGSLTECYDAAQLRRLLMQEL